MKITNTTNFRANLKENLDIVGDDKEVIVITRKDDKNILLISLEKYNKIIEEMEGLKSIVNNM
ncbi:MULTISPECIES: type II toxin-antitoxin system Phd/YefM family antitoxin [Fusobacterium]|jgi:antitoxin YefM|uniref:Antitoxin n=1 Tax=Fusobacterium animalis TaxID=76859 RepID=A0A2B7YQJ0_9FUSO|nr:type II toxin-antitoxin system Phd/YefM family antitoxin [Fusobacterium animalis]PGH23299.1 prevent-host-death protein [Fusobacterium animalis]